MSFGFAASTLATKSSQGPSILTGITFSGTVLANICVFRSLQTINRWHLQLARQSANPAIHEITSLARRNEIKGDDYAYWLNWIDRLDDSSKRRALGDTPSFNLFSKSWAEFCSGLFYEYVYIAAVSGLVACLLPLLLATVDSPKQSMALVSCMTYNTAFSAASAIISSVWVWWMSTHMRRPTVGLEWVIQLSGFQRQGISLATQLIDLPGVFHHLSMTGIGVQGLMLLLLSRNPVFVLWVVWAFPGQEILLRWFIICRIMYHCFRGLRILSFSRYCFGKKVRRREIFIVALTSLTADNADNG